MPGFGEIVAQARDLAPESRWPVSVTTNQDGGYVSVSTGLLGYLPSRTIGRYTLPPRLATQADAPLQLLSATPDDPDAAFAIDTADQIGLTLSCPGSGPAIAHFTLVSWAGSSFDVAMDDRDGALVGTGPGIGAGGERSTVVIAFGEPQPSTRPAARGQPREESQDQQQRTRHVRT